MVPAGSVGVPVNRHVAYCRPHSMNTLEIALPGTKKAQIGGKISASAPAHCRIITRDIVTHRGGCRRPDSIGAQIWAVFMRGLLGAQISPDERRTGPILTTRPNPCPAQN